MTWKETAKMRATKKTSGGQPVGVFGRVSGTTA